MTLLTFFSLVLFALFPAVYAEETVAQPQEEVPVAEQNATVEEQDQDQELEDLLRSLETEVDQENE
ncbi:hypothetical protein FJ365_05590 [Candidatus Dependentiae bacterium]|nr:hypothetical protein [Candidatus Dependentiae bacterium]